MADPYTWSFTVADCSDTSGLTLIHAIQGSGTTSPVVGQTKTIEGIVVGDFQTSTQLRGFFVEEEAADQDADPLSSEGSFVFQGSSSIADLNVGDKVRLTGTVTEYADRTVGGGTLTQLSSPTNVLVCSTGNSVTTVALTLPEAVDGDLERYEGMLVSLASATVAQNYFLGRYGQMTLSGSGRLYQPTNQNPPGSAAAIARASLNARSQLILDDGRAGTRCGDNPNPVPYLGGPPPAVIRAGDTVSVVGVLDYGQIDSGETGPCNESATLFTGDYRLHPTQAPTFTAANPRPAPAPAAGGRLKVVGANALNYFNTFGTGACAGGVGGTATDCRGANNATEFQRQSDKLIEELKGLNADIIGLMEIENDGYGSTSAIQDLLTKLNAAGIGTYAFINADASTCMNTTNALGTDAIKVGLLYKSATVTPTGVCKTDQNAINNRPPLAQTFKENATDEVFAVVVNHLKSKGCDGAIGADLDQGDGQGCYNDRRKQQATQLLSFVNNTVIPAACDPDVLLVGDFNAYAQENPITILTGGEYTNLINTWVGADAYSYIFDGQSGYLDNALASGTLAAQVTGTGDWHINADEPAVIDYNTDFNPAGYYTANQYRASDHDPVIVGLNLLTSYDLSDLTGYSVAWHTSTGLMLGATWATGHAAVGGGTNDGVVHTPGYVWPTSGTSRVGKVDITVSGAPGYVTGWIDWNQDNDFGDAGEQVITNHAFSSDGTQTVDVPIPDGVALDVGSFNARFRVYSTTQTALALAAAAAPDAAPSPSGGASGGEAEDYAWAFSTTAVTLRSFTAMGASGAGWPAAAGLGALGIVLLARRRRK